MSAAQDTPAWLRAIGSIARRRGRAGTERDGAATAEGAPPHDDGPEGEIDSGWLFGASEPPVDLQPFRAPPEGPDAIY